MPTRAIRSRSNFGTVTLFKPDDPLAPNGPVFQEPWHAQVLAIADTMIRAGTFSGEDWAQTLGASLRAADAAGKPDTSDTYYACAVETLERLVAGHTGISADTLSERKETWARAYLATPHGQPVLLTAGAQN